MDKLFVIPFRRIRKIRTDGATARARSVITAQDVTHILLLRDEPLEK